MILFRIVQKVTQIFGLLLSANFKPSTFISRPIWSHCAQIICKRFCWNIRRASKVLFLTDHAAAKKWPKLGNRQQQQPVWPDWAIYCTLGNFLKPLATIILPKSSTLLGNFCKGVKIFHIFSEIIFGQLL